MANILIVEDEPKMRRLLEISLGEEGHNVQVASDAETALKNLHANPFDVILTDVKLPGMSGVEFLHEARRLNASVPIVVMTAYGSVETAVEAMKMGASDYVLKPFTMAEMKLVVAKEIDVQRVRDENRSLKEALGHRYHFSNIVARSAPMQAVLALVERVASTNATVLIGGESGVGKDLIARAIHQHSRRAHGPFIKINSTAIPDTLFESELFGYERGAFTGANQRKIGRVEAADGGTLFLDEIGDLPLESQASLLRFLQERKIERLGGQGSTPVDVRIISATHVDMQSAMLAGRFRADLYHRLCVLQIDEPPLRVRGKDIELLAEHMLERFRKDASRRLRGFSPCAIAALHNYNWPGNVRELINRVRRAIVMCEGRQILASDLELGDYVEAAPTTLAQAREAAERQAIEVALLRHRGRLGEAADELGISRVTLYRMLTAYGLRAKADRPLQVSGG